MTEYLWICSSRARAQLPGFSVYNHLMISIRLIVVRGLVWLSPFSVIINAARLAPLDIILTSDRTRTGAVTHGRRRAVPCFLYGARRGRRRRRQPDKGRWTAADGRSPRLFYEVQAPLGGSESLGPSDEPSCPPPKRGRPRSTGPTLGVYRARPLATHAALAVSSRSRGAR